MTYIGPSECIVLCGEEPTGLRRITICLKIDKENQQREGSGEQARVKGVLNQARSTLPKTSQKRFDKAEFEGGKRTCNVYISGEAVPSIGDRQG